jgi:uncharacterized small protein (DUF1192 family)
MQYKALEKRSGLVGLEKRIAILEGEIKELKKAKLLPISDGILAREWDNAYDDAWNDY